MIHPPLPHLDRLRSERGFTLIIALGVMFVTSLLLVAAFTVANGEISTTRRDTTNKQSYYAALAGLQEYEYRLQANPDYWQTCEGPKNTVPEEKSESYEVEVLPASTAPKGTTACVSSNPFATVIESGGSLANTFRIKSTGFAGNSERSLVATFKVTGFLDFIYYTNYETEDPALYANGPACAGKYYSEWSPKKLSCEVITFISGDEVNGPMHTNDATRVEGTASFGRKGHSPLDAVEIDGGTYPQDSGQKCTGGEPKFYTATSCYTKGATLIPPESDTSLTAYVKKADEFEGLTRLVLNGSTNTISVVNYNENEEKVESTISWPENGLIYVKARTCGYNYEPDGSDDPAEAEEEKGCGNVYVSGTYSRSLTIAGEGDVIINGNIYPTNLSGKLGNEPTGTATVGLIASEYVRIYHPVKQTYAGSGSGGTSCKSGDKYSSSKKLCEYQISQSGCDAPNLNATEDPNKWGSLENIWVYAAILSTSHSFLVDNFTCGEELGKLNIYGAIAQDYRGIVGTSGETGYIKDYKYDGRLATDEPPYFLAPLKAGWKIIRETAPSAG
jgi:Tfp pilus assembly protein PilX